MEGKRFGSLTLQHPWLSTTYMYRVLQIKKKLHLPTEFLCVLYNARNKHKLFHESKLTTVKNTTL